MVQIYINDCPYDAKEGSMIIEVADRVGIHIPRFCYHPNLSIAANCRMCLVETSAAPRPVPACATPVSEGLRVQTCSDKVKAAQSAVLEFLLINHPLDCPVCDQGGECELQDLTMQHAHSHSHFDEEKRTVPNLNLGPLVATEMNRCIHCTRCVRFGSEIADRKEIGALGRGEYTRITNALESQLESPISSNIIDLCPVGALTSKPKRFTGRTWEYQSAPGVAMHDGTRAKVQWHIKANTIARVSSRAQPTEHDYWLSDRDRFGMLGLTNLDRFNTPLRWSSEGWKRLSIDDIQQWLLSVEGPVRTLLHSSVSRSDRAALNGFLFNMFGSKAERIEELTHRHFPWFDFATTWPYNLNDMKNVLVIGSSFETDHPIVALHLRNYLKNNHDNHIVQIGLTHDRWNSSKVEQKILPVEQWPDVIADFLSKNKDCYIFWNVQSFDSETQKEIAQALSEHAKNCCVLGVDGPFDPAFMKGRMQESLLDRPKPEVIITVGLEPADWNSDMEVYRALHQADLVMSFTAHQYAQGLHTNHILLPLTIPLEQANTYQSFWLPGELMTHEKVLQPDEGIYDLSHWMQILQEKRHLIKRPIERLHSHQALVTSAEKGPIQKDFSRLKRLHILKHPAATDYILRRSPALQKTPWAQDCSKIWIASDITPSIPDGASVELFDTYGNALIGKVKRVASLPSNTIIVWSGHQESAPFFGPYWQTLVEVFEHAIS